MSDTVVSLLTPPGKSAIATIEVHGPSAWQLARELFKPAKQPLKQVPECNRFWFGTLAGDEVILAVTSQDVIEIHCHGGPRIVLQLIEQFVSHGCIEAADRINSRDETGSKLLQRAPTLRTASILLDQISGAFSNEIRRIIALIEAEPPSALKPLRELAELGTTAGRHLVEPWKIVIAGPPNVGKSTLVNALAGFQRAIVSDTAGTTRDPVSVRTAFDGWPVELIDTAGLRDAVGLEAAGIERARRVLGQAELVLWVMDASSRAAVFPDPDTEAAVNLPAAKWILIANKADRAEGWTLNEPRGAIRLSALTGEKISTLIDCVAKTLVPDPPSAGAAVPYTERRIESVAAAFDALASGKVAEAMWLLREAEPDERE